MADRCERGPAGATRAWLPAAPGDGPVARVPGPIWRHQLPRQSAALDQRGRAACCGICCRPSRVRHRPSGTPSSGPERVTAAGPTPRLATRPSRWHTDRHHGLSVVRRSPQVKRDLTIGVDIGGTKIAAGMVDPTARSWTGSGCTPRRSRSEAVDDGIIEAVERLRPHERRRRRRRGRRVRRPAAARRAVRAEPAVARRTRCGPGCRSGSACRSWSRTTPTPPPGASSGSAPGVEIDDMVLVTVGTGVGGGIVADGQLLRGAYGVAAELGHMRVVPDGRLLRLRQPRLLGAVRVRHRPGAVRPGAGRGVPEGRRGPARRWPAATPSRSRATWSPRRPRPVTGWRSRCSRRSAGGSGRGSPTWRSVLDPAMVVIGGGVAEAGDLLLEPARTAYVHRPADRRRLPAAPEDPQPPRSATTPASSVPRTWRGDRELGVVSRSCRGAERPRAIGVDIGGTKVAAGARRRATGG